MKLITIVALLKLSVLVKSAWWAAAAQPVILGLGAVFTALNTEVFEDLKTSFEWSNVLFNDMDEPEVNEWGDTKPPEEKPEKGKPKKQKRAYKKRDEIFENQDGEKPTLSKSQINKPAKKRKAAYKEEKLDKKVFDGPSYSKIRAGEQKAFDDSIKNVSELFAKFEKE